MAEDIVEEGVHYSKTPDQRLLCFEYKLKHEDTGREVFGCVYCQHRADFQKLLHIWNQRTRWWKYGEVNGDR